MRYLILSAAAAISLAFTGTFLPNINIAGISPDIIICVIASIAILEKSMAGAVIGLACGLILDLFFTGAIGFYAIPYFVTGAILFFVCTKLNYIDRYLLPVILASGAYLLKELIFALLAYMMNISFSFGYMLIRYILPEMLFTGVFMLLTHFIFIKIYRAGTMKLKSAKDFKRLL
ncbi:MAG: rod shape-determining protein MreD [Eubacteriales bacterium]|nr:rod shape-determining protein MreD [Eubacteriales bacterium]